MADHPVQASTPAKLEQAIADMTDAQRQGTLEFIRGAAVVRGDVRGLLSRAIDDARARVKDPPAGPIAAENLAEVIANLDTYVQQRAEAIAKADVAREKDRADRRIRDVREKLLTQLQREKDLTAELRRQLKPLDRSAHMYGAVVRQLRTWLSGTPVPRVDAFGEGYCEAMRDVRNLMDAAEAKVCKQREEARRG
jgi:hypothetical protein